MIVDAIKDTNNFSFTDYALMSNYVKLATEDINGTYKDVVVDKTHKEDNPLVKPIINNAPDAYKPLGFLAEAFMLDRWSKEKNAEKRQKEMILANIIEAGALHYSGEPWQLQYGFNF